MSNESFVIRRLFIPWPLFLDVERDARVRTRASRGSNKIISNLVREAGGEKPMAWRGEGRKIEEEAKKGLERKPVTVVGGVVGKRSAGSRRLFHPMVLTRAKGGGRELGALSDTRPGMALLTTLVDLASSPRRFAHSRNDAGTRRGFLPSRGEMRLIYHILILARRKSPLLSSLPHSPLMKCPPLIHVTYAKSCSRNARLIIKHNKIYSDI